MSQAASDKVAERRRRILEAARLLMLRDGLRGTTMEAIAREARIAKPTLYAQFADKEAVFAGILDDLTEALVAGFDAGMAGPGSVAQRIGAAMAGKYGAIARVIEGSPFAEEFYATHSRVSIHFRALDARMNAEIVAALKAAGVAEPGELNRLIQAASYGIARKMIEEATVRAAIAVLCERLIGPELG